MFGRQDYRGAILDGHAHKALQRGRDGRVGSQDARQRWTQNRLRTNGRCLGTALHNAGFGDGDAERSSGLGPVIRRGIEIRQRAEDHRLYECGAVEFRLPLDNKAAGMACKQSSKLALEEWPEFLASFANRLRKLIRLRRERKGNAFPLWARSQERKTAYVLDMHKEWLYEVRLYASV
jgi:hypothetical protein